MIVLYGVCLTYFLHQLFYIQIDSGLLPNKKPFNCAFCISFWVAFGIFLLNLQVSFVWFQFENWKLYIPFWITSYEPLVICIPLAFELQRRILNRI